MDQYRPEYFERRERIERAAAKNAASAQARRVHQELAQRYAALAKRASAPAQFDDIAPSSRLTIIARSTS